ncbi:DNA primase [Acetobacter fallax]|uniref:DNA primase n=1 Tax=Acetobacter fallax TaxID=1737473 RepID=A0ABX0K799_9PROT|nr:DNA primase [Acetobacter fallax]NHO31673.1 DNA primase [Acetobacter fallax]NHO35232.1 DNA primase [Acetobacter fallax]
MSTIDAAFLDELRARTPIAPLIGRRVKLSRSGRNWKGCCPFHGEKTPSFYVYDDHYHCFGCGVHGDVISFVMQIEGKSFPEAVENLASEAGLEVPKATPQAREQAVRARTLGDVLEAAQRLWTHTLRQPEGRPGLDYLRKRGLTDDTITSFGLGWASDKRGALVSALREQNITPEALVEAGLMSADEEGRPKGELFWGRVTFPIRDRRGDLVSFGGRILGDRQPKYLNGPETALFSKRRLLFGLDRARAAIRAPRPKGAHHIEAIVVEGYMDVIALHQAGFTGAVAPLGTALTPEQLEILWQVAPSPILCFDGDTAGRRAAIKAAETALPLLSTERGLRFCMLPEGEDPDSLIRTKGRATTEQFFTSARPLADILFDLLAEGTPPNPTPEQRATLRARLVEATGKIADKSLAGEYRSSLLDRFFQTYRGRKGSKPGSKGFGNTSASSWTAPAGPSAPDTPLDGTAAKLAILTALVLRYPRLTGSVADAWCQLDLPPDLAELRAAVLDCTASGTMFDDYPDEDTVFARMMDVLTQQGLGPRAKALIRTTCIKKPGKQVDDGLMDTPPEVQWWHFYASTNRAAFEADIARDNEAAMRDGVDAAQWDRLRMRILALTSLRRLEDDSC